MGHYDPGKKGYIVLGIITFFILFFSLWFYVYFANQASLPG